MILCSFNMRFQVPSKIQVIKNSTYIARLGALGSFLALLAFFSPFGDLAAFFEGLFTCKFGNWNFSSIHKKNTFLGDLDLLAAFPFPRAIIADY